MKILLEFSKMNFINLQILLREIVLKKYDSKIYLIIHSKISKICQKEYIIILYTFQNYQKISGISGLKYKNINI